jgi:hypothetical protein
MKNIVRGIVQNSLQNKINRAKWYNSSWNYRQKIVISSFKQVNVLTNYNYKITLTSSNFNFTYTKSDGSDFVVTSADGLSLLDFYLESYNVGTQTGVLYVKIPSFPILGFVNIYLYYGNATATSIAKYDNIITSDQIKGRWLFNNNALNTSGFDTQTTLVGLPSFDSGGNGIILNGTSQYLSIAYILSSAPATGTLQIWYTPQVTLPDSKDHRVFWFNSGYFDLYIKSSNGGLVYRTGTGAIITTSALTWTAGTKYLLTLTWSGTNIYLYRNEVLVGSSAALVVWSSLTTPFYIGSTNTGSVFLQGLVYDFKYLSKFLTVNDVTADFNRVGLNIEQINLKLKLFRNSSSPVLIGDKAWELHNGTTYQVFEPSVVLNYDQSDSSKKWCMLYSGRWDGATGLAYSSDLITWTKYSDNPVIGQGYGGVTGATCRNFTIYNNGYWYMYYSTGASTSNLYRSKSTNLINWSNDGNDSNGVVIANNVKDWSGGWQNSSVWITDDNIWHIYVEGYKTTGHGPQWFLSYAYSSDGKTWTFSPDSSGNLNFEPMPTLQTGVAGVDAYCSLSTPKLINSKYYVFYHGRIRSNIYMASSDNVNGPWVIYNNKPILTFSDETNITKIAPIDQIADVCVFEYNNKTYIFYDADNNIKPYCDIRLSQYNGTMAELINDISIFSVIGKENK